jgi:hypothetical protein
VAQWGRGVGALGGAVCWTSSGIGIGCRHGRGMQVRHRGAYGTGMIVGPAINVYVYVCIYIYMNMYVYVYTVGRGGPGNWSRARDS